MAGRQSYLDRARPYRQQAIELLLDDRIALAGTRLEAGAMEHGDASAAVFDQPGVLQVAGRLRDTFTSYAQHVGDQLLRHHELAADQSVETQQQPAAELLVQ